MAHVAWDADCMMPQPSLDQHEQQDIFGKPEIPALAQHRELQIRRFCQTLTMTLLIGTNPGPNANRGSLKYADQYRRRYLRGTRL